MPTPADGGGDAKVPAEKPADAVATKEEQKKTVENNSQKGEQRPRRRSNTKGDQNNTSGRRRSGSRRDSLGTNNANNSNNNKNENKNGRKDWAERKSQSQGGIKGEKNHVDHKDHKRTRSTNSNNGRRRPMDSARTMSQTSNGDYSDEFPDDLDEPFTDSEDDTGPKQPQKMSLALPRGRIRTLSGTVPQVGYSPKWGGPTMCLSCLQFFDLPEQLALFSDHLLKEHKIMVSEMNAIVDPKRYIEHWRQRFAKESVDKIFPKIEPQEGEPHHGVVDFYYHITETISEDYSLRQRLAMRRLEEALSCQQREREDKTFQLQCIFCRYTARGNRSKIIHHLYMIHHLNLGSPDNLVFVTEYIEHLKFKMQNNECIYCEKQFQDKNTLMDHMRKRNHREVNPKNHYYDKFYIINYLELGKRWLDVLAEDFEDTMATFQDSDEEEEDNSWCEWQEDNLVMDETRVLCLMCDENSETVEEILDHMKESHKLDLLHEIKEHNLSFYDRSKLINYVRKQNFNGACWICQKTDIGNTVQLAKHLKEDETPFKGLPEASTWNTEENLVPMFGNDHLLWLLESYLEEKEQGPESDEVQAAPGRGVKILIEESKQAFVDGVIAEDLPELKEVEKGELDSLM